MGIQSSLFSGVSGLNANGNALTVLGNNIANSNTIGFKASRTIFSDLLSAEVAGSGGASQVGRGAGLSTVDNIFSQGTFETTESNTDLAIEGPGFFMVSSPTDATTYFTRAGAFNFDETGTLVNPEGYAVQGYYLNNDGETVGDITDLQIETRSFSPANPTSQISLATNLNANSTYLGTPGDGVSPFDITDPADTSNYASSVRIFDSLGREHLVTTYFNKLDPDGNPSGVMQWESHTVVSGADVQDPVVDEFVEVGRSILSFDTGGRLVNVLDIGGTIASGPSTDAARVYDANGDLYESSVASYPLTTDVDVVEPQPTMSTVAGGLSWVNEAEPTQQVAITFGATQYSSESDVISQTQDGYSTGTLVSLTVDNDGNILGNYSNGEPRKLARIALAKFSNPVGLAKAGNNLYGATDDSGSAIVGTVGSGVGKIFTNSLEMSNVDLAQEFVKMITTQRGFQANSKIITTTDELLGELINLKR
ncbi:flagellar hook protein FlgE [uncultured Desulfuromonas sp.]|uniref:flagellar hook protein FlgE n=1 Tax=uncultured Desulfuromonas sp. TaxID=181013 RepID=UPI002AAC42F4|nr:flagellar hook protein FlgE [uncultured Desulfuromonas sp.]